MECFACGKKGHYASSCPNNNTHSNNSNNNNPVDHNHNNTFSSETSTPSKRKHWRNVGPNNGESETVNRNNSTYTWCSKCKRWTTGERRHGTLQHVGGASRSSNTNGGSSNRGGNFNNNNSSGSGNVVGGVSKEWTTDGRLKFSGGLFLGKIEPINNHSEIKSPMNPKDIKYHDNFDLYPSIEDHQKAVNTNETTEFENYMKDEVQFENKVKCHGWLKGLPRL